LNLGYGLMYMLPKGGRLNVEFTNPLVQNLRGVQLETDWGLAASYSKAFWVFGDLPKGPAAQNLGHNHLALCDQLYRTRHRAVQDIVYHDRVGFGAAQADRSTSIVYWPFPRRHQRMSNNWKLSLIVVSIAIGLSSALVFVAARRHTQRQAAAMTLIRDMDRVDQRLSQASREFGIALRQFLGSGATGELGAGAIGTGESETENLGNSVLGGVPGDDELGTVQQAHRTLTESVSQSIAVVSRLEPPESEHGAAFISSQRKFLLVQRGIIREDFGELLRLLDDTSRPLPQRLASIDSLIDTAYAETEKEFASVAAAREKFAREFAIHLTAQRWAFWRPSQFKRGITATGDMTLRAGGASRGQQQSPVVVIFDQRDQGTI
jgi:hypothetical protein